MTQLTAMRGNLPITITSAEEKSNQTQVLLFPSKSNPSTERRVGGGVGGANLITAVCHPSKNTLHVPVLRVVWCFLMMMVMRMARFEFFIYNALFSVYVSFAICQGVKEVEASLLWHI